jgi:hypothetical protein
MTLSTLTAGGDNKRVTLLGSMLFLRCVSGTRAITGSDHKDVASYHFEGWFGLLLNKCMQLFLKIGTHRKL